jgi:hypothetical protein
MMDLFTLTSKEAQAIKSLIRDDLGCGCPEEVFSKIQIEKYPIAFQGLPIDSLIKVGNRLLVAISPLEALNGELGADIIQILALGKQLRDETGFNRFRLVITSKETDRIAPPLQELFAGLSDLDNRVHLHFVRSSTIPPFLLGPVV